MEDIVEPRLLHIGPGLVDRELQERGRESALSCHREQSRPSMREGRPNRLAQGLGARAGFGLGQAFYEGEGLVAPPTSMPRTTSLHRRLRNNSQYFTSLRRRAVRN